MAVQSECARLYVAVMTEKKTFAGRYPQRVAGASGPDCAETGGLAGFGRKESPAKSPEKRALNLARRCPRARKRILARFRAVLAK